MQELHLVGFTTDRRHLIFSSRQGAKSGSFLVPVDEDLLHAVEGLSADTAGNEDVDDDFDEEVVAPAADTRVDAKLSVREVQAQLRAGVAVEEIAARAEVDPGWVERFALPIRAEQQQVVSRALDARMERPRAGQSALTLGDAVSRSMAERDLTFTAESFASAWSSRLVGADLWSIEFTFSHRGRRRTVAWTFEAAEGRLTTSDRLASQIGFVAGAEPRPSDGDEQPKTPRPVTKKKATGTKKKSAAKSKPTSKKSTVKKSAAKKSAAKKSAAKKSAAKKSAAKKSAAKKSAAKKQRTATPRKRTVAKKRVPTAKRVAAARKDATERLEKATAQRVAAAKKAAERKSAAAGKAAKRRAAAEEKEAARAARAAETRRRAEQAEAESSAEKDREAARAVAAAERQLAEERQARADAVAAATAAPDPEPEPDVRESVDAETVEPETVQPESVEPETATTDSRPEPPPVPRPAPRPRPVAAASGPDVERRPDQAVVRLRAPQPSVPAEDPAARVAARRARAAERSVSTAQFRSGSAVQAAPTPVNGAGAAIPEGVRRRAPREAEPPADSGDGRRPRPDGRRTRTRQLRAR